MDSTDTTHFDVIVIGCGPGGERAAILAARAGKKVAVIERHHVVGGTRINWGTIPSKTLRESALLVHSLSKGRVHGIRAGLEGPLTVADFMHHEKSVVKRELDLINLALDRNRIRIFHGQARFVDPNTVAIIGGEGQTRLHLRGEVFVIATGSSPNRPVDVPFDDPCVFDSNGILGLQFIPRSMLVLGAGVIGVEYACIFAALGIEVTLVDTRTELLPYLDREIADILEREMSHNGIVILHDDHYERIECLDGDPPKVRCSTRKGNLLEADVMLYCVGRDGNTRELGLENVGIEPSSRGLLKVNEFYQTVHSHIYAVGDVIGYPALASTSMEQGRQAMRHAFALPGATHVPEILPFAIYSIPELSYIGENENTLQEKGLDYIAGRGRYALNPRGQILGDTGGMLKLLFDAECLKLLGVHITGTNACELIHTGQAYLRLDATAEQIASGIFNYPTLSDLYRHAAFEAIAVSMQNKTGPSQAPLDEYLHMKHLK